MWKLVMAIIVLAYPVCCIFGIEACEITLLLTALCDGFIYCWLAPRS